MLPRPKIARLLIFLCPRIEVEEADRTPLAGACPPRPVGGRARRRVPRDLAGGVYYPLLCYRRGYPS